MSIQILSATDKNNVIEFIHKLNFVNVIDELQNIIEKDLKKLIEFTEYAIVLSGLDTKFNIVMERLRVHLSNFNAEWSNRYQTKKYHLIDPIIEHNFSPEGFKTFAWEEAYNSTDKEKKRKFIHESTDFFKDGVQIGKMSLNQWEGSSLSLSDVKLDLRIKYILNLIYPSIHNTLKMIFLAQQKTNITKQEKRVLELLQQGFSLNQIAEDLNISVNTVNIHSRNIKEKLDVFTQTQAVAESESSGILRLL
jgi:DNA-binding CsgD family transcriptional regulator